MNQKLGIVGIAAAGALLLVGCSTSPEEAAQDTADDNAAACEELAKVKAQTDQVRDLAEDKIASGDTITVDQAKSALAEIKKSVEDAKGSSQDLSESLQTQFEQAEEAYREQLDSISDDQSVASAAAEVKSAQRQLVANYDKIISELGCQQ